MSALSLLALVLVAQSGSHLDAGASALAEFRPEEALVLLEKAEAEGPYSLRDKIRLHEQLGIAHAYLDHQAKALAQFALVLTLDRGHFISYTLSPKVTFLFEKARDLAADSDPLLADVSWPRGSSTEQAIPVDIEIISDADGIMREATLFYRLKGESAFQSQKTHVEMIGLPARIDLPPLARALERDAAVEVYLSAYDDKGNEVFRWGSKRRPREISLSFVAPDAWYQKWWVWTLVGGAVAAGTGVGVFFATQQPADTIQSSFEVLP